MFVDVHAAARRQQALHEEHAGARRRAVALAAALARLQLARPEERVLLDELVEPRVVHPLVEHRVRVVVEDDVVGPHVAQHAQHRHVVVELEPPLAAPHVVDGVGR